MPPPTVTLLQPSTAWVKKQSSSLNPGEQAFLCLIKCGFKKLVHINALRINWLNDTLSNRGQIQMQQTENKHHLQSNAFESDPG